MQEVLELEVVDLGDAKEVTKGPVGKIVEGGSQGPLRN